MAGGLISVSRLEAQAYATPAGQVAPPVFEEWSVVMIDGKQCGFSSTITTQAGTPQAPQFQTITNEVIVIKRMGLDMKMVDTSTVIESPDGAIVNFNQISSGMGTSVEVTGHREGNELVVSSHGQTQHYKIARLAALGPEKTRQLSMAMPLKVGATATFNSFVPEYPQAPVASKQTVVDQESRKVLGQDRKVWKQTGSISILPGTVMTAYVDEQNNDVEMVVPMAGVGDVHQIVTDRATCMKPPVGIEIFSPSLIRPDHAIPQPRDLAQASYRITSTDISAKLTVWDGGEQRVISSDPGVAEIEVTVPRFTASDVTWQLPHADTPDLHIFLQSTAYLEANDPLVQKLAQQALGDEKNPVTAAHKIEHFVSDYITTKDLRIDFASAADTAKSREGDCTEHAVLCAALGRAAGLPTRCVIGLGYIPPGAKRKTISDESDNSTGIFAFHMWAEAWVGPDQWVPMDAALGGFDAAHIAFIKNALEDINPMVSLNAPMENMISNLKVEVLKTTSKADYVPPKPPVLPMAPQASTPVSANPSSASATGIVVTPPPALNDSGPANPPASPTSTPAAPKLSAPVRESSRSNVD